MYVSRIKQAAHHRQGIHARGHQWSGIVQGDATNGDDGRLQAGACALVQRQRGLAGEIVGSALVSAFPARSALPMALVIATVELVALFCFQVIALRALQPHERARAQQLLKDGP